MMRASFDALIDHLRGCLAPAEAFTAWFQGESSDFVRMNQGKVRQPGSVSQRTLSIDLIRGQRHAGGTIGVCGDANLDRERVTVMVDTLRAALADVPDDPFHLYHHSSEHTEMAGRDALPDAAEVTARVLDRARGLDFVGIYAAGRVYRGFASSFGQRNWFERASFHLDFSVYLRADKAVKGAYAGETWNEDDFAARLQTAVAELEVLGRPPKTIEPGTYRVYLAPPAMAEILSVLSWSGFGEKSHRTKQTVFLKMLTGDARLDERITLTENTADSTGPAFGSAGFLKPSRVELIKKGQYVGMLCSPRSAKEYGVPTNGARDDEMPQALDLAPGNIPTSEVTARLDTGIFVSHLWYLNYSDRPAGRITGMTRFATLWVEKGRVVAPLNVMRFDETIYRIMGSNLLGLTRERDFILDNDTYYQRSTGCTRVPGALVRDMRFTL
ncbi:MAG TPA: metallopeptidase TldD-related protein [Polyangiaceae bacterium]|nr:metallopeptidase TldD-related protein [Polyangiaceae bacterium]